MRLPAVLALLRPPAASISAVRVRGPFKGPSGYDHHTREFVRELHNQGVAVELIDFPHWGPARLAPHQRDPWFESLGRPVGARVALHFCMPHQVAPDPGLANVNFTMFEATRISPLWVARSREHDLIVLPTESSRRAWVDSGVPADRVRLCPLGIDTTLFGRPVEPMALHREDGTPLSRYATRFLNVSAPGPRKNLVGLLRAWIRATSARDDAVLIVKLGADAPGWGKLFKRQLASLRTWLGKGLDEAAPVHVVRDIFSDAEMPALYAAATNYISLSFGEGWDQAMVEAAATGLRLIAPSHSAYAAYLDSSVANLIPSREVPAVFDGDAATAALFEGATWWEPDEDAAIACIRAAIEGRDGGIGSARQRILTELTWERATRRLIAILAEVEPRRRRRFWPWLRAPGGLRRASRRRSP